MDSDAGSALGQGRVGAGRAPHWSWVHRGAVALRPFTLTPDDTLVELSTAGNEAAFGELFRRHRRGLLAYARHMLGDPDEAEDAVQHAFEAAHRTISQEREIDAVGPWLYAVTRNRCLSLLRTRRPCSPLTEDTPGRAADDLAATVERREELRTLLADIGRLPEQARSALLLIEVGDLSHLEVAAVLGVPALRVKKLVFQARTHLAAGQQARSMTCLEVREELSTLTRGALRRSYLRAHLEQCEGCAAFRDEVRRQRRALALLMPAGPGGLFGWSRAVRRARPRAHAVLSFAAKPVVWFAMLAACGGVAAAAGVSWVSSPGTGGGARPGAVGTAAGRLQQAHPGGSTVSGAGVLVTPQGGRRPPGSGHNASRSAAFARLRSATNASTAARLGSHISIPGTTPAGSHTAGGAGTSATGSGKVSGVQMAPAGRAATPPSSTGTAPGRSTHSGAGSGSAPAGPSAGTPTHAVTTSRPVTSTTTPTHGVTTSQPVTSTTPTSTSPAGSSTTSTSSAPPTTTTTVTNPTTATVTSPTTTATSTTCTSTTSPAQPATSGC